MRLASSSPECGELVMALGKMMSEAKPHVRHHDSARWEVSGGCTKNDDLQKALVRA